MARWMLGFFLLGLGLGCSAETSSPGASSSQPAAVPVADGERESPLRWDEELSAAIQAAHAAETAGQFSEALATWRRVREDLARTLPADHWQIANCDWAIRTDERLSQLNAEERALYAQLQALDERALRQSLIGAARNALTLLNEAQAIAEQLLGPESVLPLNIRWKRARLAVQVDEWEQAAQEFRRGIELGRRLWPPNHPELEQAYADLAAVELQMGNEAEAAADLARALQIAQAVHGPADLVTARRANDWGVALHRAGRPPEALQALQQAEQIRRAAAASPTLIAECQLNMAAVLIDLQQYAAAQAQLQAILAADAATPLAETIVLEARSKRATLATLAKNFTEAVSELQTILSTIRGAAGDLNPRYAEFAYRLGMNYGFLGKFDAAEQEIRHALSVQASLLGQTNPATRKSAQALAAVLTRLGRHAEASDVATTYDVPLPTATTQK